MGQYAGKPYCKSEGNFLSQLLGLDLGYRPHFYGPYSPVTDESLGEAKALGFVKEEAVGFGQTGDSGFEYRRYDFSLTEDGKQVVAYLMPSSRRMQTD